MVRYSARILDWSDQDLREMDVKTRKTLTMFGAFHKEGSAVSLSFKSKDGWRGLISMYDCVTKEELSRLRYVRAADMRMLDIFRETLQVGETKHEGKRRKEKAKKETVWEKLHGKFMRDVSEVVHVRGR